ncbi:MAG: SAM-dependent methyltransferase [Theionarchaea archaeon]|nr:SAM-dependent methyltransferase [Theionarchaea archaeon]MBU6999416.1 SAM-dependent methyltransferase [Theionarchaea archaeon]MBU7022323.1 SAM-dependent methyltransferase [Theionarchaea archaeon]MBU7036061.1 SAM-dependent methyltransferase [Theionarchaea archaeon]
MQLKSIGKVIEIEGDTFKLLIDREYEEQLAGLDNLDKILVIYWVENPENKPFYEQQGIFATNYTGRPNPLGIDLAELVTVEGNLVIVHGLKARIDADIIDLRPG